MNRNSRGSAGPYRRRSAVAVGVLSLVLMLTSGGTWATAAGGDSDLDAPQSTSSIQAVEATVSDDASTAPTDDTAAVSDAPTARARTANADGAADPAKPVDTPTATSPAPADDAGEGVADASTPEAPSPAPVGQSRDVGKAASVTPTSDGSRTPTEVDEEEALADDEKEALADDENGGITPFAIDDGALVWTVKDVNTLVGGAKIRVQGPATRRFSWQNTTWTNNNVVVDDCIEGPCTGPDQDPAPGQFRVTNLGNHNVQSNQRYRVQQETAPDTYNFVTPSEWIEISGNGATASENPWTNDEWDFGNFPVRKLGDFSPVCAPGYVYGLSDNGWIRQVGSGQSSAINFGSRASDVNSFNGLGIGSGGEKVFAYERTTASRNSVSVATIWSFDTDTGVWSNTNVSVNSNNSSRTVAFVAGAVDLDTGNYYLGGFSSNGQAFRIWEYVPGATTATYKGYINTSAGAGGSNNGDMAFDSAGNLFVVRGSGSTTTVFSVTAANFQAATGGLITSAPSQEVTTMNNVNGVAFDASGKAYLGSGDVLRSFEMPAWTPTGGTVVVGAGLNSTDLATCSSPATVTLEKDIPGGRFKPSDQFQLELKQGTSTLGTATTIGSATGIQGERVGPLPVAPGSTLQFNESFVGSTNAADYATSWSCTSDGEPLNSGSGIAGNVTVPPGADAVVCRITNQLLVATVNIHKEIVDVNGNESAGAGWTVGAGVTATSGTATPTPAGATQVTNATGDASWTVRFDSKTGRARVVVSEQMQSGYEFAEGTCVVEKFEGSPLEVPIVDFEGLTLEDVGPGDTVSCEFLNRQLPATVQVDKQWTINGGDPIVNGEQPDGLTANLTLDPNLGTTPAWGVAHGPYAINDTVTIGETAALDKAKLAGCSLGDPVISGDGITGTTPLGTAGLSVELAQAANSYTITNPVTCEQSLTLVKTVVNDFDGQRLPTDWKLESDAWNQGLFAELGAEKLTFDSGEAKTVAVGEYVLTETAMNNYVFDSLTCDGVPLTDGNTVTVGLGQSVTCAFTNKDAPGSVTWTKVDETGVLLSGSEWKLVGPGGEVDPIEDCVEADATQCTGFDKDPAAGQFKVEGLAWGDYDLVETKAPAGYLINTDPHTFTISQDELDKSFVEGIVNVQRDGPVIPMTGGLGSYQFWIAAGLLGALAGGGVLWQRRGSRRNG